MNIIGLCQGANLRIFLRLLEVLRSRRSVDRVGIFVADAHFFYRSPEAARLRGDASICWLPEWESLAAGFSQKPDMALISRFENEIGPPFLWAGLLADRRIFFGRFCKSRQDYRSPYTEEQMLGALTEAIKRVEELFEKCQPDVVFGFVPVSLHEYVALRLAEARGIPILLLRSTKIQNFVSLNDCVFGLSHHVRKLLPVAWKDPDLLAIADAYIDGVRSTGARYEGMHTESHASRQFEVLKSIRALIGAARNEFIKLINPKFRRDPHNPGYLIPTFLERFQQPWRALWLRRFIRNCGRSMDNLDGSKFCLFPLHFEPEIALQVYGRPFQNQIEVARSIALALPAGMKLVVKEHPRSAGFRPITYYKKLLEIPNVLLAPPEIPSHALVRSASLVSVITGNIGLEAAAMGIPVVVLGEVDYAKPLLNSGVVECHDLYKLSATISSLLEQGPVDRAPLRHFLAALVGGAVPVDLYSTLLNKQGRESFSGGDFESDMLILANYVEKRLDAVFAKKESRDECSSICLNV